MSDIIGELSKRISDLESAGSEFRDHLTINLLTDARDRLRKLTDDPKYSINSEGVKLLDKWKALSEEEERTRQRLNRVQVELLNATNDLGRWMVPAAQPGQADCNGEVFSIWVGDGLLCATQTGQNDFNVYWRKRETRR